MNFGIDEKFNPLRVLYCFGVKVLEPNMPDGWRIGPKASADAKALADRAVLDFLDFYFRKVLAMPLLFPIPGL